MTKRSNPPTPAATSRREYLEVTEQGRLRLYGARTQDALLSRPGRWRLLETSTDFVLFQRIHAEATPVHFPPGRTLLSGDLSGLATPVELLSFLQNLRATCWALFGNGPVRKTLIFFEGDLLAVQSNQTSDRLGEVLYRFGYVDRATLDAALRVAAPPRRLGTILREAQTITAQELWQSVRRQMEEVFFGILAMREGSFHIVDAPVDQFPTRMALDTRRLLFEGLKRIDETKECRKRLPDDEALVVKTNTEPKADPEPGVLALMQLLGTAEPVNLSELYRRSRLGPFHGLRAAHQALELGLLRLLAPEEELSAPAGASVEPIRPGDSLSGTDTIPQRVAAD